MGTTIEDVAQEEHEEEQYLNEQIDLKADEEIKNRKDEFYQQSADLFSNISSSDLSDIYKKQLVISIKNNLWEYGVIVIWKSIILFCYEKLFQLNTLNLLHENFKESLLNHNKDCVNCFSFNCIKDKYIGDNLSFIWRNVDQNYQNMFSSLLYERNSLSHVNEYSYSEVKFMAYFEKSLELLNYLESLHLKYLPKIIKFASANNYFPNLSEKEISKLLELAKKYTVVLIFLITLIPQKLISDDIIETLKENAIKLFTDSMTFDGAYYNGSNLIIPLLPFFKKEDYLTILNCTFKNQEKNSINQIIHAGRIETIFMSLYNQSSNNEPEINNEWKEFIKKIIKNKAKENFSELISLIKENTKL